jgi:hypothetical protein
MDCAVCVLAGTVAKINFRIVVVGLKHRTPIRLVGVHASACSWDKLKPGLQLLHCQFRDGAPFGKFILPNSMEKRAARKACGDLPQPRMS